MAKKTKKTKKVWAKTDLKVLENFVAANSSADKVFSIKLEANNEVFTTNGATLMEALMALPRPAKWFTKGMFAISKDGKVSKSFALTIPMLNRLFWPGMTGDIQRASFAKRYTILS